MDQSQTMMASRTTDRTAFSEYTSDEYSINKVHKIADLNRLYSDGDSADQVIFAEMRSNLLLVAGDHYNKRDSLFYRRIRDSKDLTQEQKLRLTKNHIRKICQIYSNNIMSFNPGVGFTPKDENSMHDQKVAEMHHSVWRDGFNRYDIEDKMDDWCDNFVQIGEVHTKIFWDESIGKVKGYNPQTDEEGNPVLDMFGNQTPDENSPIYEGGFVFEDVYGFNLLRPPECRELDKAEWLGIRKMVNKDDLLAKWPGKKKFIVKSQDDTYMVFDAAYGGYYKAQNQVSVREYYFRPCMKYPRGYFYITTKEGILAEGELPGGFFPIVSQVFDKIQTTARGRSPVKQMRPYQIEINRAGSKMAEHQVTLGDDKLLIQGNTKISAGVALPGVRSISYTGMAPGVLQGRSGDQYLNYMLANIKELYEVMSVAEDSQAKTNNLDPWTLLYQSARNKKVFQRYIKKFEKFLIKVVKLYLNLAKIHLQDDALIYAIGKSEQVNIPEFKAMSDISFEIDLEAQADDVETKLGKQMTMNHLLQYVGGQLKPEEIAKIVKQMPFANVDGSLDDLTLDYDSVTNEILALDRGELPPINANDNHLYCIKRLTSRMRKADFKFLSPLIQRNYEKKVAMHQQIDAQQKAEIMRAEKGLIPTSGYLVSCQFYVTDPSDPTGLKTRQARIPSDSMTWLMQQLKVQGSAMASFDGLPQGAKAQEANMIAPMMGQQPPNPLAAGMAMAR